MRVFGSTYVVECANMRAGHMVHSGMACLTIGEPSQNGHGTVIPTIIFEIGPASEASRAQHIANALNRALDKVEAPAEAAKEESQARQDLAARGGRRGGRR